MSAAQRSLQRRMDFLSAYARGGSGPHVLAVVIQKWETADFFFTLLSLLGSSPAEKVRGWAGNFTKVRVFGGHLGASHNILNRGAVVGNGLGLVLLPESNLNSLSAKVPPLRTQAGSAEKLADFSVACPPPCEQPPARLQVNVRDRRLEQFIVDSAHVLSECHLLDERAITSGLTFEHVLCPPTLDEGFYHRVVPDASEDTLVCHARLIAPQLAWPSAFSSSLPSHIRQRPTFLTLP